MHRKILSSFSQYPAFTRIARRIGLLTCTLTCTLGVVACSAIQPATSWQTYRNPRFGFEFVYPNSWTAAAAPSNDDGQAFTDPKNPAVEVRGWAVVNVAVKPATSTPAASTPVAATSNFQTAQGWTGNLSVEIGRETSTMTLKLNRENVEYGLQGKAPSQDFAAYYPTFAAIAQQYKVPQPTKP